MSHRLTVVFFIDLFFFFFKILIALNLTILTIFLDIGCSELIAFKKYCRFSTFAFHFVILSLRFINDRSHQLRSMHGDKASRRMN